MCDKKSRTKLSVEEKWRCSPIKKNTSMRHLQHRREPEDEVVLELVDSGESGVIVAAPIRQSSHK